MVNWVDVDFVSVPESLLDLEGVVGVRICYDALGEPFSYHAMKSKDEEIGYMIPQISSQVSEINREWYGESLYRSTWVEIPVNEKEIL